MRLLTASFALAIAVLCLGTGARADDGEHVSRASRCVDRPVALTFASFPDAHAKAATQAPKELPAAMAASLVVRPRRPAAPAPGQSRAPVTCLSPDQPGCQVSVPEAPHRISFALAFDAADAAPSLPELPPADVATVVYGPTRETTPGEAHARLPWRPPSR